MYQPETRFRGTQAVFCVSDKRGLSPNIPNDTSHCTAMLNTVGCWPGCWLAGTFLHTCVLRQNNEMSDHVARESATHRSPCMADLFFVGHAVWGCLEGGGVGLGVCHIRLLTVLFYKVTSGPHKQLSYGEK